MGHEERGGEELRSKMCETVAISRERNDDCGWSPVQAKRSEVRSGQGRALQASGEAMGAMARRVRSEEDDATDSAQSTKRGRKKGCEEEHTLWSDSATTRTPLRESDVAKGVSDVAGGAVPQRERDPTQYGPRYTKVAVVSRSGRHEAQPSSGARIDAGDPKGSLGGYSGLRARERKKTGKRREE
ncbi:hypothetical protein K438DRAFT_1756785 [Mycena galopus ATCC 62051]|nr:hypothetical protein K438DRAFT_1756785 [Mycena galopus ATCC 62051]